MEEELPQAVDLTDVRDALMVWLYTSKNYSKTHIAVIFNVSKATVTRVVNSSEMVGEIKKHKT